MSRPREVCDQPLLVVGNLPIAMYHHTGSAHMDAIRREGLKVGKPTNFFTQQGVYVTTIQAGEPVSVYSRRAARGARAEDGYVLAPLTIVFRALLCS